MRLSEILIKLKHWNDQRDIMPIEDMWDLIARSNAVLPMYELQKNELDKRYDEYMFGKYTLHNWDKVHNDLRRKLVHHIRRHGASCDHDSVQM